MKHIILIICLAMSFLWTDAQDLSEIIAKTNNAIGARSRAGIQHLRSTGYFVMTGTEAKMPFKLVQSKPGKVRIETTVFGFKVIQTYDGQKAWLLNPTQGMEALPASVEDMEFIAATTAIEGPFQVRQDGRVPRYEGMKEHKGKKYHVIRIAKSSEEHVDHYIDPDDYLIRTIRYEYKKNGAWYSMEYKVESYQEFMGALFPKEITVFLTGVEMTSIYVTDFKQLKSVDASRYQKPSY